MSYANTSIRVRRHDFLTLAALKKTVLTTEHEIRHRDAATLHACARRSCVLAGRYPSYPVVLLFRDKVENSGGERHSMGTLNPIALDSYAPPCLALCTAGPNKVVLG